MQYEKITLKNGLRIVLAPMAEAETVTVLVMTGVGSRYESRKENGIAHFLEHMMFKGTAKRPTAHDISAELDGIGAEYNAFTGKECTGYYAKVAAPHATVALDVVSDIFMNAKLEQEEITKAEADESYRMVMSEKAVQHMKMSKTKKGARYTPVARRQDKPEAIAWIIKHHPYIPDSQIVKLIGTTKKTIDSIRGRTHWNVANIKPKDAVLLGLCMQSNLEKVAEKFRPAGAVQVDTTEGDSSAA